MNKLFKILTTSAMCIYVSGCANTTPPPSKPMEPQGRWQTVQEVIKQDLRPASSKWIGSDKSKSNLAGMKIGIDSFEGNTTGAPLASQNVAQKLLEMAGKNGLFKVIDRSKLIKRKNELEMTSGGFTKMTEEEQLQALGKSVSADYLLDGSVVEYSSDQKTIPLQYVFKQGEETRYEKDYNTFISQLNTWQQGQSGNPADLLIDRNQRMLQAMHLKQETLSLKQYKRENGYNMARSQSRNIAAVGITARLIDVKTGEFVWLYQSELKGFSVMDTMDKVVEQLVSDLTEHTK